jgi:hypothetical protein
LILNRKIVETDKIDTPNRTRQRTPWLSTKTLNLIRLEFLLRIGLGIKTMQFTLFRKELEKNGVFCLFGGGMFIIKSTIQCHIRGLFKRM